MLTQTLENSHPLFFLCAWVLMDNFRWQPFILGITTMCSTLRCTIYSWCNYRLVKICLLDLLCNEQFLLSLGFSSQWNLGSSLEKNIIVIILLYPTFYLLIFSTSDWCFFKTRLFSHLVQTSQRPMLMDLVRNRYP